MYSWARSDVQKPLGCSTNLKAMRCQSAMPDAIGEARLVPGLLPVHGIRLGYLQEYPGCVAAVHCC